MAQPATAGAAAPHSQRHVPPPSVNDLGIRVGTINGSGSQSSNVVLLRALHHMGIPCSGKNIFPSNIEGLPTWFHLRASEKGYVGHRLDPQIVVCMHELTAPDDVRLAVPGSIVIHRDDFKLDLQGIRDDVRLLPAPFQRLVEQAYPPDGTSSYRDKMRKVINMVYVGVLSFACGVEMEAVEFGIRREFPGRKARAAEANLSAARAGFDWASAHWRDQEFPWRVRRIDQTAGQFLIDGNRAAGLGLIMGGVNVLTWYPITPSSSLPEAAEDYLQNHRVGPDGRHTFAVIQAEDELAAIGMVVGAGWAGARAATATSGPGISLMTEFIGLAYFAEIPAVVVDVQRMGPSTGLPTRTSQGDVEMLHHLGHGDARHPVYLPGSIAECFEMTAAALDLAQMVQAPVFVATDLDLGMNLWLTDRFRYPEAPLCRGKVLSAEDLTRLGGFARYKDVDGDAVPYRTLPGTPHPAAAYFTRGTGHNDSSGYSEKPEDWRKNLERLARKLETALDHLPPPVIDTEPRSPVGLLAYGSTWPSLTEARDLLREQGVPASTCRLRALPFAPQIRAFVEAHERVYVIEQNRDAQVYSLLRAALEGKLADRLASVTHFNGIPIAAENIAGPILERERWLASGPLVPGVGTEAAETEALTPAATDE